MYMTVTALHNQVALASREFFYFSKSMSRLYHQRKLCCVNNHVLEKFLPPSFAVNTWKIPSTSHSTSDTTSPSEPPVTPKNFPDTLTKEQAKIVASKLTSKERDVLLIAIHECISEEQKAGFEDQLAGLRWRSKFGRPSKILSLGDVDPTGTYCPVPEDWLLRKCAEKVVIPTTKQLIFVALMNAIPFIGFGFFDNFIMIVAGDQIEMIFNRKFPISTMTAAALGNTISDVIGIGSTHYIEQLAYKVGFKPPNLSQEQLKLTRTTVAANMGRVMGVTIGCIIGMAPIPIINLFHQGG